jgi:DNA (cytosine-5)-methyltransferase 1
LDFKNSIKEIESLPDTDVIIGSPPCVTFSNSNISGKADKTSGVTLTEVFLRIVAVKKHKKNSKLKAWYMENVTNSVNYLSDYYTFKDLGLTKWAKDNRISPYKKAIILKDNQPIINSADYGSAQKRKRVISGEIISKGKLTIPHKTHKGPKKEGQEINYVALRKVLKGLPIPNRKNKSKKQITDPLYPTIKIKMNELTDHFYDTGLFSCEWKQSRFLKVNHPYMGRMSFPENQKKPSRTITATKIGTSRKAIIYRSEYNRKGNGQFRTPTVREAACIMGFPITYQFKGSEGTKWRLIGNAVCPSVSRAFAKQLRRDLKLSSIKKLRLDTVIDIEGIEDLNTYKEKTFLTPPRRNKNSRFRRHPFKDGNLTVTLSNYDIVKNEKKISKWMTSVQYGNGEGFPLHNIPSGVHKKIEPIILGFKSGKNFVEIINNGFSEKIGTSEELQMMYEQQFSVNKLLEPTELVEEVSEIIRSFEIQNLQFDQNGTVVFEYKTSVPAKQLYALYAISKICSFSNKN